MIYFYDNDRINRNKGIYDIYIFIILNNLRRLWNIWCFKLSIFTCLFISMEK